MADVATDGAARRRDGLIAYRRTVGHHRRVWPGGVLRLLQSVLSPDRDLPGCVSFAFVDAVRWRRAQRANVRIPSTTR